MGNPEIPLSPQKFSAQAQAESNLQTSPTSGMISGRQTVQSENDRIAHMNRQMPELTERFDVHYQLAQRK